MLVVSGKDSSSFTLRVHACPPPGFFKPSRFHPQRNNIRTDWYTGLQNPQSGKSVEHIELFAQILSVTNSWPPYITAHQTVIIQNVHSYSSTDYFLFVIESAEPPTPLYNSSVLGDLLPRAHLQFLSAVSSQCSAFANGVALLKVWLRQRELDQV